MSRYTSGNIAYGFDHMCGYFYQLFDNQAAPDEELVEEADSLFDGLTGPGLVEWLDAQDVSISDEMRELAMMDLPI